MEVGEGKAGKALRHEGAEARREAFLSLMHKLVLDGAQFIIATHSPIIMAYPRSWIYVCEAQGLKRVEYKETEHYKVSHAFLARPEKMLSVLLDDPNRNEK